MGAENDAGDDQQAYKSDKAKGRVLQFAPGTLIDRRQVGRPALGGRCRGNGDHHQRDRFGVGCCPFVGIVERHADRVGAGQEERGERDLDEGRGPSVKGVHPEARLADRRPGSVEEGESDRRLQPDVARIGDGNRDDRPTGDGYWIAASTAP